MQERHYTKIIGILYDIGGNYFVDDNGNVIADIFHYITTNDLLLFKKEKSAPLIPMVGNPGIGIEIFFDMDAHWNV